MPLTDKQVIDKVEELKGFRDGEMTRLSRIRLYMQNKQQNLTLPSGTPQELRNLWRVSKVNLMGLVVRSTTQSMYVDGFRAPKEADDEPAWEIWQRNRLDARQIGVHKAGLTYGTSYAIVLPGEPVPVIRGSSPLRLTAVYLPDEDWPEWALEQRKPPEGERWRLFDKEHVYTVTKKKDTTRFEVEGFSKHGAVVDGQPVVPIVRFRDTSDVDGEVSGVVEPLIPLQDQINITTFGLLVAQHFSAFRQRYIIGWTAETEEENLKASAAKLWTFDDDKNTIEVGEFDQTDLSGYINSREASIKHLASVSQTPAHELLGQLINLSAEALAAAEASHRRGVTEVQTVMGEAWEQTLALAGSYQNLQTDPMAYVRWRDTEARSMAQMADALGKLVTMLGVPPQELWERVPGVTQQEIERWKAAAAEGDAFANLEGLLTQQAAEPEPVPSGAQ